MDEPHFAQVALSVADMAASLRFYVDGLGFRLAGGRYASGPGLAAIQGLPDPACVQWWLVTDRPFFQLELFQYTSPAPAPRTDAWRASDIGYSRMTLSVPDVQRAVDAAERVGGRVLARPRSIDGTPSASLKDPTGVPVELVEAPDNAGPRLVGVTASVPGISAARQYFVDVLGMTPLRLGAVDRAREMLWGTAAAEGKTLTLAAGEVRVELSEYRNPSSRPRRAGFQLNDHGILNIALGYRDWAAFEATYRSVVDAGHRAETPPMGAGGAFDVSYCTDADGFSVELLYCPESSDEALGFVAERPLRR